MFNIFLSFEEFGNVEKSAEEHNREHIGGEIGETVGHNSAVMEVVRAADGVIPDQGRQDHLDSYQVSRLTFQRPPR